MSFSRKVAGGDTMADVLAVRNKYRMENWSALIQECNASGLSNREFCQQRGISEKKLLLLAEETPESSGRYSGREAGKAGTDSD